MGRANTKIIIIFSKRNLMKSKTIKSIRRIRYDTLSSNLYGRGNFWKLADI